MRKGETSRLQMAMRLQVSTAPCHASGLKLRILQRVMHMAGVQGGAGTWQE